MRVRDVGRVRVLRRDGAGARARVFVRVRVGTPARTGFEISANLSGSAFRFVTKGVREWRTPFFLR